MFNKPKKCFKQGSVLLKPVEGLFSFRLGGRAAACFVGNYNQFGDYQQILTCAQYQSIH